MHAILRERRSGKIIPMSERPTKPDAAHDILAADEFAMPAPDPDLHHHGPVRLPEAPFGDIAPHDVLAAEEFPMPAARPRPAAALVEQRGGAGKAALEVLVLLLGLWALRRWRA